MINLNDPEIKFASNIATRLNENLVDRLALGTGLNGNESLAEQTFGGLANFRRLGADHDAPLVRVVLDGALAASSGMDLTLDDGNLPAQLIVGGHGLVRRLGDDTFKHWHASLAK